MLKLTKNIFFGLLIIIATNSCLSRHEKHGYMFDLSDHYMLKDGITTKDTVLKIMGSPTFVSDLDNDETWIYYSEEVKKLLFFKPTIIDRTVIAMNFDNNNVIKDLKNYDLSHETELNFTQHYTEVQSEKTGFFKSIFGNIGQVRPQ